VSTCRPVFPGRSRLVSVAAVVLAAATATLSAQALLVDTVRGLVRRQLPDGRLIPGTLVRVSIADQAAQTRTSVTGQDGFYYFKAVRPGSYRLSVFPEGLDPLTYAVEIRKIPHTDIPPVIVPSPLKDYRTAYKNALRAIDQEDWSGAAHVLAQLLARHPEDARTRKEQIRISGNYIEPYRPYYYLGLALQKLGDCPGALRQWEKEENLGPPQRDHREGISKGRAVCSSTR
jgi:hypothetical protein